MNFRQTRPQECKNILAPLLGNYPQDDGTIYNFFHSISANVQRQITNKGWSVAAAEKVVTLESRQRYKNGDKKNTTKLVWDELYGKALHFVACKRGKTEKRLRKYIRISTLLKYFQDNKWLCEKLPLNSYEMIKFMIPHRYLKLFKKIRTLLCIFQCSNRILYQTKS